MGVAAGDFQHRRLSRCATTGMVWPGSSPASSLALLRPGALASPTSIAYCIAVRQLRVAKCRNGSITASAVIRWRGRYTSNSGHEDEKSARPFRAINSRAHNEPARRLASDNGHDGGQLAGGHGRSAQIKSEHCALPRRPRLVIFTISNISLPGDAMTPCAPGAAANRDRQRSSSRKCLSGRFLRMMISA
jgi:hypothetical protein